MERKSVLIADDSPDTLEMWRWVLEIEGFNVQTAEDGSLALEILKQDKPDVLITDLMMPQLSGFELIRHIRSTPHWRQLPIIAVSACPEYYLTEAQNAGANRVIRKPVEFKELIETINECLAGKASQVFFRKEPERAYQS